MTCTLEHETSINGRCYVDGYRDDIGFSFSDLTDKIKDEARRFEKNSRRERKRFEKNSKRVLRDVAPLAGGILMVVPGLQIYGALVMAAYQADRLAKQKRDQKHARRAYADEQQQIKDESKIRWDDYMGKQEAAWREMVANATKDQSNTVATGLSLSSLALPAAIGFLLLGASD